MNITETLCKFATELSYECLDQEVVRRAKIHLLDTIGAMLAGSATESGKEIIDFASHVSNKREASIVGTPNMASYQDAAFANASLVEILELQDGHKDSGLHPSSVVPPAALAMSEYKTADGKAILTAIVAGYEIMTRIGRAIRLSGVRTQTFTTGICGAFAAAATASKLLGQDYTRMASALGIAGYFTPLSLRASYWDQTVKPLVAGQTTAAGIVSLFLTIRGFTGSTNILSEFYSEISPRIDETYAVKGLGETFQMTKLSFKRFPCCRFTHAGADATLDLIRSHEIDAGSVDTIIARTFDIAAGLHRYTNTDSNYVKCQFSYPYVIAAVVSDGELGLHQFSPKRIADPALHELAKRVELVVDEEINRQFPDKYAATVEIRMKNGRVYGRHVDHPRGDPENPLTDEELMAKFRQLSLPVIGESKANEVMARILSLEQERDVAGLVKALRRHPSRS